MAMLWRQINSSEAFHIGTDLIGSTENTLDEYDRSGIGTKL